ncbi:unnamed protein product [Cyclocybe aegerita]|uniref:Fungal-type protein kinase domain-containing protein n=1 Tax=Cyclocybe aegerita TaxID=1973307 RepID=A0A8S0WBX2_CYCAE|nr:unnamed protein product [Cyclocybe aegerita]
MVDKTRSEYDQGFLEGKSCQSFVRAWLEAVTCHAFLWKHGVEHGDPSLYNIMYDPQTHHGVMTDFDLAIIQFLPRIPGTDRTGTVPFMATDLLSEEYWFGLKIRYYHHELEAFIWVLPFIFLLYEGGIRGSHKLVDPWITSDYKTCAERKVFFLMLLDKLGCDVKPEFKAFWELAWSLCVLLLDAVHETARNSFRDRNKVPVPEDFLKKSRNMWTSFIDTLREWLLPSATFEPLIKRLKDQMPNFERTQLAEEDIEHLLEVYRKVTSSLTSQNE